MKAKFLFLANTLLVTANFSAQVGINTPNPQAAFHVDGGKDNTPAGVPTVVQQTNDFVVTSSGSVGVGTVSPSTRLEINNGTTNGAIKIVDGTQSNGYVLTSDANGVGTWKAVSSVTVSGTTPTSDIPFGANNTTANKYMNASIVLPKGSWMVYLGFLVNKANTPNSYYAARFTLSSSTTAILESGYSYIAGNKYVLSTFSTGSKGASEFGFFASGVIRVKVTDPSVTLYLWDNNSRSMSNYRTDTSTNPDLVGIVPNLGNNGENYIFAVRAD